MHSMLFLLSMKTPHLEWENYYFMNYQVKLSQKIADLYSTEDRKIEICFLQHKTCFGSLANSAKPDWQRLFGVLIFTRYTETGRLGGLRSFSG